MSTDSEEDTATGLPGKTFHLNLTVSKEVIDYEAWLFKNDNAMKNEDKKN